MAISTGITNNRGVWTKKYPEGTELYFSTYVEYTTGQQGRGIDAGATNPLNTYLVYKRPRGLVTEWVTAAVLGPDGKFVPLKNSQASRITEGNKLEKLGSGGLYDYPPNDYVVGEPVRADLVSNGKDSLRYQTINNAKYLLIKDSGESPEVINNVFRTSHNITPSGQQPSQTLFGPSLNAEQATASPNGTQNKPTITPVVGFEELDISEITANYKFAPASGLRYPNSIESINQDRIKFTAKRILPRVNFSTEETKFNLKYSLGNRDTESVDGPVIVAIQAPINDQNSVEWGGDNVNPIDAAVFGLSISLMKSKSFEDVGNTIQGLTASLYETFKGTSDRFKTYLAGQAANINNVVARTDNVILNPNMELLFNGPQLRPFTFTFKMSARSEPEARTIKRIINYFKYHMAVRKENNELFLRAPHVFDIQYCYNGEAEKHPGINEIKTCALTNFSVDYTPLGSYATYRDGTMTAYTLNMQFQELRPIYDTDYEAYRIGDDPKKPVSIGP